MKKTLTYVGRDDEFRPVYKDDVGIFYKDTDPRAHVPASLYSLKDNVINGALDRIFNKKVKFVPKRITW